MHLNIPPLFVEFWLCKQQISTNTRGICKYIFRYPLLPSLIGNIKFEFLIFTKIKCHPFKPNPQPKWLKIRLNQNHKWCCIWTHCRAKPWKLQSQENGKDSTMVSWKHDASWCYFRKTCIQWQFCFTHNLVKNTR